MIIKHATDLSEYLQIHELNYKTFVEEIPQHQKNGQKTLVDKFHYKNKYIIAKTGEKVIGMVCYNMERPFSLDEKIPDLDSYLRNAQVSRKSVYWLSIPRKEKQQSLTGY